MHEEATGRLVIKLIKVNQIQYKTLLNYTPYNTDISFYGRAFGTDIFSMLWTIHLHGDGENKIHVFN